MKKKILVSGILIITMLFCIIPLYWTVRTSLLEEGQIKQKPLQYIPKTPSISNYDILLGDGNKKIKEDFMESFLTSIVTCGLSTVIISIIAVLAGYSFSVFQFKFKKIIYALILGTIALPIYSIIIPLYSLMVNLELIGTLTGITCIYVVSYIPLAVWFMKNFFDTIPIELYYATKVDGASSIKSMFTMLPLILPGLASICMISFLSCWSQYLVPTIFGANMVKPVTVFTINFIGKTSIQYGLMAASGILAIIPPVLVVVFFNKYLINGIMNGAIKK